LFHFDQTRVLVGVTVNATGAKFARRLEVKPMKTSTWNRAEGKLREVEGALKEAVGAASRNRNLDVEGKFEKRVGKIQGNMGRVQKAAGK